MSTYVLPGLFLMGATAFANAHAQDSDNLPDSEELQMDTITIASTRLPGSARTDLQPEIQYDSNAIRALGVSDISELIEELASQTSSGRGRGGEPPIVLLDGNRIPSFREIRAYPSEAIDRVEILPEEVALAYGYPANQKVINIVLRDRFNASTYEVEAEFPEQGSGETYELEGGYLRLRDGKRLSFNLEFEKQNPISESDRDLEDSENYDPANYLQSDSEELSLSAAYHLPINTLSTLGINAGIDAGNTYSIRGTSSETGTLITSDTDTVGAELNLNYGRTMGLWMTNLMGNYTISESDTESTTNSNSLSQATDIQALATGPLLSLPTGKLVSAFNLGYTHSSLESESFRDGLLLSEENSDRQTTSLSSNLDIPLIPSSTKIPLVDRLNLNLNGKLSDVSDFGNISTWGGALQWKANSNIRFLASYTLEEAAPSLSNLSGAITLSENRTTYDYLNGESVLVDRISGGNAFLENDEREVIKLGTQFNPFDALDLSFRVDYTDSVIENPVYTFTQPTAELEALYPDRFVRDDSGTLIQVNATPINAYKETSRQLNWGLDFTQTLIEAPDTSTRPPRREGGDASPSEPRSNAGRGGGRRGPPRGMDLSSKLRLSLDHEWRLEDTLQLTANSSPIDFLDGGSLTSSSSHPEHTISARASFAHRGMGVRMRYSWQSASESLSNNQGNFGDLYFDDYATIDLRFFYFAHPRTSLAQKFKWLSGTRFSLDFDNLLDEQQRVTDGFGNQVAGYFEDELDPVGRSIEFSIRKQFR